MRSALLAVLLVLAGPAVPARADAVPVTGSWTQLRLTTPFGDSPDLQSQDGPALPVENGPTGVIAFAAVRWDRPADLTLARVDAAAAASAPTVWACPATTWPSGDRQPWSERPTVDCTRHVVGTAVGDRMTWRTSTFGSAVDVVLVPAPADSTVFVVSFGAPTVDSFAVTPSATPSPPAPEPVEPAPPVTALPPADPRVGVVARPPAPQPAVTVPPPPVVPAPVAQPRHLAATATTGPEAWPGRLLLAFLSLLLIARAAFPSRPLAPPSSLVPGRPSSH
jgi:hypothetical protein